MEKNGTLTSFLVDGVVALVNVVQGNEIFQTIIFILTLLSIVLNIARNIYNWYNESKRDGKIDADEIKKGVDIIDKGIIDIKDACENHERSNEENATKK
nr:MAG TPA: hypothetical protein [Caudoviricetes sp.]